MNHFSLLPKMDQLHADGRELVHNLPSLSSKTNCSLPIQIQRDKPRNKAGGGGGGVCIIGPLRWSAVVVVVVILLGRLGGAAAIRDRAFTG